MKKTALVTGAKGFVGSHMRQTLTVLGWDVTVVDTAQPMGIGLESLCDRSEVIYDLVVHAAAAGPNRAAIDSVHRNFPYNVGLDAKIFEWAIRTRQKHIVYLSSCAVYSNELRHPALGGSVGGGMRFPFTEDMGFTAEPFDVYGHTKRIGERMAEQARRAGVIVTVVRPFSGYGTTQSADFPFGAFVKRALNRENPFKIWGSESQVRDWIHIDDICDAIMRLVDLRIETPVNLCTGIGTSMLALADLCTKRVGYDPELEVVTTAPMGAMYRVGDPSLLNEFYTPRVSIEEGVKRALGRI